MTPPDGSESRPSRAAVGALVLASVNSRWQHGLDALGQLGATDWNLMPIPDLTPGSELRAAVEQMADGPLAYLLGAGASVSAGLPTWGTLLGRLLGDRGLDETAVSKLLQSQDPLLGAEAAFPPAYSRRAKEKRIFKALYETDDPAVATGDNGFTPSPMHLAVAEDAVRRGNQDAKVMTLNYDDLQEEAFVKVLKRRRRKNAAELVHGRGDALTRAAKDQFEVHHLHGFLPRQQVQAIGDSLILTLSDYSKVIDKSWQRNQVCEVVQHGPTLMLGTSYSDPDIRTWLGSLGPKERRQLLAVISRPAFGISRAQMDTIRPVIVNQWRSIGVEVLVVDDYATPTQIVRELAHVTSGGYIPPSARVASVLTARISNFNAAQQADVEELAKQVKWFASELGDTTAVTLWLHDGSGQLVRWATSDRTYRDVDSLRRIDADPDSAWIAAQAVCFGSEVIRNIDVRTAELGGRSDSPGTTTGRWSMVGARPVSATLPGGPVVTVGALSVASTVPKEEGDIPSLQKALDRACKRWETLLAAP